MKKLDLKKNFFLKYESKKIYRLISLNLDTYFYHFIIVVSILSNFTY